MAHGTLINGAAYGIAGGKCLVGGTEYAIKKGRTLVGGTGYDIAFSNDLSQYPEGSIVYVVENDVAVPFYVSEHNYESQLNGLGRTLLVRKSIVSNRMWSNSNDSEWENVSIYSWLNGSYLNRFGDDIKTKIGTTKYKYRNRQGAIVTVESAVFFLSTAELGVGPYSDGTELPISETLKTAYNAAGTNFATQWTRTTYSAAGAFALDVSGTSSSVGIANSRGARPVITLPDTTIVGPNDTIQ